eukprot:12427110-Karenia_brevis.AAC.1
MQSTLKPGKRKLADILSQRTSGKSQPSSCTQASYSFTSEVLDGSALAATVRHVLAAARNRQEYRGPKTLVVTSACSGSGMDYWICHEIGEQMNVCIRHAWLCDNNERKLAWLDQSTPGDHCIFQDIVLCGPRRSRCYRHHRHCKPASGFIFIAGFSCKALSRANPNRKTTHAKTLLQDAPGS